MDTGRISGCTRVLGAPRTWDVKIDGHCGGLPIRDDVLANGQRSMTSAWFPNTDELHRILAGAPIYLTVLGQVHPPVAMAVGPSPEE